MGPGGNGRKERLSGKVKAWQRPPGGAWAGAGTVAPSPQLSQWARAGGGGKALTILGSHFLQVLALIAGHRPVLPEVICVLGARGGLGERGGFQGESAGPTATS